MCPTHFRQDNDFVGAVCVQCTATKLVINVRYVRLRNVDFTFCPVDDVSGRRVLSAVLADVTM